MKDLQGILQKTALLAAFIGLLSFGMVAQNTSTSDTDTNAGRQDSSSATKSHKSAKTASEAGESSSKLDATDRMFVKKAAEGGLAEVELGQLATQKASSDEVKKFGQRMVDDHSKANDQLKQVASSLGVTVPDKLSPKDEATKDRLSKLNGKQFDAAYMRDMVRDHTKDVAEFRQESEKAKNSEVKNFASQTLPTLEDHLKEAKSIAPKETRASNQSKPSAAAARQ